MNYRIIVKRPITELFIKDDLNSYTTSVLENIKHIIKSNYSYTCDIETSKESKNKIIIHNFEVFDIDHIDAKEFRNCLLNITPQICVQVIDSRFDPILRSTCKYGWSNNGVFVYYNGTMYVDPQYDFYADNTVFYSVTSLADLGNKLTKSKHDLLESGVRYMWSNRTSQNNIIKSVTLDEALREVEDIHLKQLTKSVDAAEKHLENTKVELSSYMLYYNS